MDTDEKAPMEKSIVPNETSIKDSQFKTVRVPSKRAHGVDKMGLKTDDMIASIVQRKKDLHSKEKVLKRPKYSLIHQKNNSSRENEAVQYLNYKSENNSSIKSKPGCGL